MIKQMFSVFVMGIFIMSMPTIVHADFADEVKLLASDGAYANYFGRSVSISGDTAIVGANSANSAYIFVRNPDGSWTEKQKLTASDAEGGDNFGSSVSISGDMAIVGATGADAAYVFVRDTSGNWTEQEEILYGSGDDYFGNAVSISGDTAIVGAPYDDDNGRVSGAAYIFVHDSLSGKWLKHKLLAYDGLSGDWFGGSVSISGDTAIVGAYGDDDTFYDSGAAYIFVRDTDSWKLLGKLTASDDAYQDNFGYSVSISGDTAIIGATGANAAYVFVRDSATGWWTQKKKLTASDRIGYSVSISGDTAIVGASGNDDNGTDSGAAYVFVRDAEGGWTEQQKLLAFNGAAYDYFGSSVAISGDTVIVGAYGNDDIISGSGAAYVYTETGGAVTVPDITVTDSVAPNSDRVVSFGDVTELTSSEQTVTVTNDGNADLTLENIDAPAAPFTIETDNCSGQVLTPAANCMLTLRFSPPSTGGFSDSFDIPSDDPDENPVTVGVGGTGVGVPVPDITVTDSIAPVDDLQIAFGNVVQATLSNQTVTITNDGNADLSIGNIATQNMLDAPFSILNDTCSSTTVAPTASCTLTVRFEPTSTGSFNDSFDIPSDDADEASVTVTLSGTGIILLIPDITVTDSVLPADDLQLAFGNVLQGTASDEAVTITNNGTADLVIGNIANANVLVAPFSLVNDNCSGQIIAATASCTLTVRYEPVSAGTFSDSFDVPSNDAYEASVTISVTGTSGETDAEESGNGNNGLFGLALTPLSLLAMFMLLAVSHGYRRW